MPRRSLRNSSVTRLMLWPHWKIATYCARYHLLTPRNGRRKFRSPVHSPLHACCSAPRAPRRRRRPAPTRLGPEWSTVAWPRPSPGHPAVPPPLVGVDRRPLQAVVACDQPPPASAGPSCRRPPGGPRPTRRPTTPATGGRSLAKVPWPRRLVGPPPRRVVRVGVRDAFFPPRSGTSRRPRPRRRPAGCGPARPGVLLEPVPQLQQVLAVAAQLAGQLRRRGRPGRCRGGSGGSAAGRRCVPCRAVPVKALKTRPQAPHW